MIVSKPKSQTVFALSLFQVIILAVTIWVIIDLVNHPEAYFLAKLLLAPILLVIWVFVAVKFYVSLKTIEAGDNKISVKFPLKKEQVYKLADIHGWKEETVKTKGGDFKELQIKVSNQLIKISNREHTSYDDLRKYLRKKAKQKG